jgi:hypothetical protein
MNILLIFMSSEKVLAMIVLKSLLRSKYDISVKVKM